MVSQERISIQRELERQILHGLALEWKTALWVLPPSLRTRMGIPLFSLRDMASNLGAWSGERREITLSRDLVLNHPWDAVCEVLLHEMAHQFAEEVLRVHGEPPHGPGFLQACRLLRANPKASGTYGPLDERILREGLGQEDKLMLRVKKLMALAESKNRYEAELAMAKAHELMGKHNLDLMARNETKDFVSCFVGTPALRRFREDYLLGNLLQDFYFVHGLWVPAYVLDKGKMGRVLEITGTPHNVKIACYVYDFVSRFICSQWREYNQDKGLNRHRKTDFAAGIIEGFRSKLKRYKSARERSAHERDLMVLQDLRLTEYVSYRYPHTVSFRRGGSVQDEEVLGDGVKIGKRLVISQGITERVSRRRRQLENKA